MPARTYSTVAILLHWLIAIAIGGMLYTGWTMTDELATNRFELYQFHKSLGLTVLGLSLVRLAWRFLNPPPPLDNHVPGWQRTTALVTHWAFYVFMIGVPLGGWAMVSASPRNIATVWFGLFEVPHLPVVEIVGGFASLVGVAAPSKIQLAGFFAEGHAVAAVAFAVLLALHVLAALKHHLIDRDTTLTRMLPFIPPLGKGTS